MRNLCSQSIKTSEILSLPAPRATINHEITVRHAGTSSTHVSQHLLHQRTPMSQHKLAHCTNRLLKHCEAAPSEVSKCKKESTRTTMQCVFDPPLVHLTVSICVCLIAWNWLAVDWQTSFSTIYIYIYHIISPNIFRNSEAVLVIGKRPSLTLHTAHRSKFPYVLPGECLYCPLLSKM